MTWVLCYFAGLCATAFHPLCAREAKLWMEVSSREDSEEVRDPYQNYFDCTQEGWGQVLEFEEFVLDRWW